MKLKIRSLSVRVFATLLVGCWAIVADAQQLRSSLDGKIHPTEVQEELEKVDAQLRSGKWKTALRHAQRVTETVLTRTWYGKEIRRMLSELALYQAVAEANLGRRDDAIWHWHIAQNLDFRMRRRDLAPYGKAGKLLREFPLRALGEVPVTFSVPETYPGGPRLDRAVGPKLSSFPTVVNNTGAAQEGTGDFHAELLIDEQGRIRQPVVITTHLHPIIIYASLEWLREMPLFKPAQFKGEPADSLEKFIIRFKVSRW